MEVSENLGWSPWTAKTPACWPMRTGAGDDRDEAIARRGNGGKP
ncbi:MAG: hypothetical protein ACLQGP_29265 [Isosphaeraceae bacterium]